MAVAADETVVLLVEVVVVATEVAHHDHSLTVVLVDLAVDAVGGDAGDVGIVDIADFIAHKFYHLVLDGVALGVLGYLLHVGGVLAELFVLLTIA